MGAGLMAAGSVDLTRLGTSFFLPLGLSPLLSLVLAASIYPALRTARLWMGVERQMCLCVEGEEPQPPRLSPFRGDGLLVVSVTKNRLRGESPECEMEFLDRTVAAEDDSLVRSPKLDVTRF